jgi:hypothetical protein
VENQIIVQALQYYRQHHHCPIVDTNGLKVFIENSMLVRHFDEPSSFIGSQDDQRNDGATERNELEHFLCKAFTVDSMYV